MVLLLKLAALVAFVGGPLYVSDQLKRSLDQRLAFGVGFVPVALVLMGALTLRDEHDTIARWLTRGGVAGAVMLLAQNGWLLHGLWIAHDSTTPGLHVTGAVSGSVAAVLYIRLALRWLRGEPAPHSARWRLPARTGDWLAFMICSAGALGALLVRERDADKAITVFVLFGGMAAFMALHLWGWRKFKRRAHTRSADVRLPDGSVLSPARGRALLGFSALLVYGALLSYFGHGFPGVFRAICWLLATLGALGLVLALARVIPPGQLRIERHALFVKRWRHTLEIPWSCVGAVSLGELHGNRLICVELDDVERVRVDPPRMSEKARAALARSMAWTGAPLTIASGVYAVDELDLVEEMKRRAGAV